MEEVAEGLETDHLFRRHRRSCIRIWFPGQVDSDLEMSLDYDNPLQQLNHIKVRFQEWDWMI